MWQGLTGITKGQASGVPLTVIAVSKRRHVADIDRDHG